MKFIKKIFPLLITGFSAEIAFFRTDYFYWLFSAAMVIMIVCAWKITRSKVKLILPFLLVGGIFAFLYIVDSYIWEQSVIIIGSLISSLLFIKMNQKSYEERDKSILAISLIISFLLYSLLQSVYILSIISLYQLLIMVFVLTYLLMASQIKYFEETHTNFPRGKSWQIRKTASSMAVGLILVEIVWSTAYLPFNYLTQGALMFIIFYIIWDVFERYYLGRLKWVAVLKILIYSAVAAGLVLVSSRWKL